MGRIIWIELRRVPFTALCLAVMIVLLGAQDGSPAARGTAHTAASSTTTTFTLQPGVDASSKHYYTFETGWAYTITISGTITRAFGDSTPPTTCVFDTFWSNCYATGGPPRPTWQPSGQAVYTGMGTSSQDDGLPGAPSSTMQPAFDSGHSYTWLVPSSWFHQTETLWWWALPEGQSSPYTNTTYSGSLTVKIVSTEKACSACASLTLTTAATDTLLQPDELTAELGSTTTNGSGFEFEIRRAGGGAWKLLHRGSSSFRFVPRLAGHFQLRVTASSSGRRIASAPRALEVQFPVEASIAADANVARVTRAAFVDVLAHTNRTWRHEEGYWIRLNTCLGRYQHTRTVIGRNVGVTETGSVDIPPRPADTTVRPGVTGCASYSVASFHSHTPTTYRTGGRGVGPSDADQRADRQDGAPGLVYDYVGVNGNIPAHWPLRSPAKLYFSGPQRRSTPR